MVTKIIKINSGTNVCTINVICDDYMLQNRYLIYIFRLPTGILGGCKAAFVFY